MLGFQEADLSFSSDDFAKALEQHDYQFQSGQVVRGKAYSYESDGVYVDIGGKSAAFLPLEEVSLKRVTDLSETLPLHEEREFMIIKEQNAEGQVTLSIRQMQIKQLWQQFAEMQESGKTVQARVNGLNKGGVTVDVLGLRGFIPRSHLIERDNLESLVGKALTVAFLEVDPSRKKLVVSQRQASQAASLGQLEMGQLVEGKIVGIKPFGLFVDFDGMTGLIHINQVSKNYVASLNAGFEVGQPIKAVIIDLDDVKRRISLSTKVLENYPGEMLENMPEVMAEATTRAEKARKTIEQRGVEGVEG
ncbi:MAG: S1 RNA-binding domain-containing protein [Leptolyngbyaceae cyanobacterium SM1_4_3]|nr:S1 RNA-binding domain-containing protein [Leptolyngbyaceae cyanobacterium SM1_4_3]NJN91238.1 S1 RNA-binding domain-containing protein [Leptolyngbyaceae cyanobacterium SL_5_14]NJO67109.1 S1 RNA-binding domain-containing protein [Leptolyngbyaceae cyanobacterium RM1_405_57]